MAGSPFANRNRQIRNTARTDAQAATINTTFIASPGAYWDIQGDPRQASANSNAATVQVGTISNDFAYASAFQNTLANIKQDMHDLLGVPDLNLESTRSLITSGKGLKALYWPLICRCEEKMNAWKPALEWLVEMLLQAAEVFPELQRVYGGFSPAPHVVTIDPARPLRCSPARAALPG